MKTRPNPFLRSSFFIAATTLFAFCASPTAFAAALYWDGTNAVWQTYTNWSTVSTSPTPDPVAAVGINDDAIFNITSANAANAVIDISTSTVSAKSMTVNSTGTTKIGARQAARTLIIGTGGITVNPGAGAVTISAATTNQWALTVKLNDNQTWANHSSSLLLISNQYNSPLNLNGKALTITGAGNTTIAQSTTATAGSLNKSGSGTLALTGANLYTGTTTISGGTLKLDFNGGGQTSNIINNAANSSGLALSGGTLALNGKSATVSSQRFNGTTFGGGNSSVTLTSNGATSLVLDLGVITRNGTSGSVNFTLPTGTQDTANGITTTTTNTSSGILGTWATVAGADWAVSTSDGTNTGNITAFSNYTDLTRQSSGAKVISDSPTSDFRIIEGTGEGSAPITLGSNITSINTLNQSTIGGTSPATIDPAGQTLAVNAILVGDGSGGLTIGNGINNGTLVSSGNELVIHNLASSTVNSQITDSLEATSLVKYGSGTLTLTAANTYTGNTIINGGTLSLQNSVSSPSLIIANGATLEIDTSTENKDLSSGTISGNGTLRKSGANTASWGETATTFLLGSGSSMDIQGGRLIGGSGGNKVWTGNLADLNVATGAIFDGADAAVRVDAITGNGSILAGNLTIGVDNGSSQFAGIISDSASLAGSLTKVGTGTITLSGANEFTGGTLVNAGTLLVSHHSALGSNSGSTSVANNAILLLANEVTVTDESLTVVGAGVDFNGSLQAASSANAEWAGPLIIGDATARIGSEPGGSLHISGGIQGCGTFQNLTISAGVNGTGTVVLSAPSGSNTYTGTTSIVRGILKLGAENALPHGTILDVDSSVAAENATFDLNGFNQTVAGLQRTGFTTGGTCIITNTGSSPASLTVNQNTNTTFSGTLTNAAPLSLIKNGSGTLSLTAANAYSGNTTVNEGTLSLGNSTNNTSLADQANVVVATGATLNLNYLAENTDTVKELWIGGVQKAMGIYEAVGNPGTGIEIPEITGSGTLTVTNGPSPSDPFTGWIGGAPYNLSGSNAAFDFDFDHDGLENGLEWILGGNPTENDSPSILPALTGNATNGLTLVINRAAAAIPPACTLVVDFDGDLDSTWAKSVTVGTANSGPDTNGVSVAVDSPSVGQVTITISASNAVNGRLFARLRAEKP